MITPNTKPFAIKTKEEALAKLESMTSRGSVAATLVYWTEGNRERLLVAAACAEALCLCYDGENRVLEKLVFEEKVRDALIVLQNALLDARDNSTEPIS